MAPQTSKGVADAAGHPAALGHAAGLSTVFDLVSCLTPDELDALYADMYCVRAVVRALPPLAQQYVFRLLSLPDGVAVALLDAWVVADEAARQQHAAAVERLVALRVVVRDATTIRLNTVFQAQLGRALVATSANPLPPADDQSPPTLQHLRSLAVQRWERVLLYMIGSASSAAPAPGTWKPPQRMLTALKEAGVLDHDTGHLTSAGFQYVLRNRVSQVWTLLEHVVRCSSERIALVTLLFQLSFLKLGQGYRVDVLSEPQRDLLSQLADYGAVRISRDTAVFYPTPTALDLASPEVARGDMSVARDRAAEKGYLIVETNNKVFAYTDAPLQIALLGMFVRMQYRVPNMVQGVLSRESVKTALLHGITAEQILCFLHDNAHERMKQRPGGIPDTIVDQIRLWERERNRLSCTNAVAVSDFASDAAFAAAEQFARHDLPAGSLLFAGTKQRVIVVDADAYPKLSVFVRSQSDA